MCRYRPCVGLIPHPRSPTKCSNRFISSEVEILKEDHHHHHLFCFFMRHSFPIHLSFFLFVSLSLFLLIFVTGRGQRYYQQ
jgi:hypothetical protein